MPLRHNTVAPEEQPSTNIREEQGRILSALSDDDEDNLDAPRIQRDAIVIYYFFFSSLLSIFRMKLIFETMLFIDLESMMHTFKNMKFYIHHLKLHLL